MPEDPEGVPEVLVVGIGTAVVGQAPQAGDAVVSPIEVASPKELSLLGNEEEEEPVNEPEEFLIELVGVGVLFLERPFPEICVLRMFEETIAEDPESFYHAIAQAIPGPGTLLDGLKVIALEPTLVGVVQSPRQACPVQQPVEDLEVAEPLLLEDRLEIELHVSLMADHGGLAEETKGLPVCDQAPSVFRVVKVLLNQGVGREARAPRGRPLPEFLLCSHDVHRGRVFVLPGTVGDGEGLSVHFIGPTVVARLVTQKAQKGDHPALAGEGGPRIVRGQPFQARTECLPVTLGITVSRGDFLDEGAIRDPEVRGLLPGELAGFEELQKIRTEESPF
ncbi:MAG: hypothetical protein DRN19_04245 [Thermoplasmata archaeon]|nr:MAG: hypothetical protein DRN19_04245 [Thermoplasmata archaeon]